MLTVIEAAIGVGSQFMKEFAYVVIYLLPAGLADRVHVNNIPSLIKPVRNKINRFWPYI
jgi:hypothetical protein